MLNKMAAEFVLEKEFANCISYTSVSSHLWSFFTALKSCALAMFVSFVNLNFFEPLNGNNLWLGIEEYISSHKLIEKIH